MRVAFWLGLLLWGVASLGVSAISAPSSGPVVIVPIEGTVDDGMAHLVQRSVQQAESENAAAIVLDVNSPGGLVSSAFEIRDALFSTRIPVVAYVGERAYSAAALITLSARKIVMAPGASIGAAEPIPNTAKNISALRAEFASTAERNGYDPRIAGAMVDKTIDVPAFKSNGAILTLNTTDALRAHIASAIEPTLDAALASLGLKNNARETAEFTFGERVARFATDPAVSGLLLTIGLLGILIEMQTLHGIAGLIGVLALVLFFGTHIYAGFSNIFVVVLALLGLFGILWELHVVPGHGVPGILGGVALLLAVLLAFGLPNIVVAMETVVAALALTIVLFLIALRILPENAWVKRFALAHVQGRDYVSSRDFTDLLGHTGTAASYLRPAGIAAIDGRRIDVLTEGEFIPQGAAIRVTRVEGARIFVAPAVNPDFS
jgi:membrane-bound serine protease (ClpP class)